MGGQTVSALLVPAFPDPPVPRYSTHTERREERAKHTAWIWGPRAGRGGRFLPPSKWDRMRVSPSVDSRQEIRASVCRRNPFKSPHLRQLLNTDLAEPLTKERKRKAARHGSGWCFTVWGAVNQPTNQLTNQPADHYKGTLALQSTHLVEEVEPLAEREKKPKPVI